MGGTATLPQQVWTRIALEKVGGGKHVERRTGNRATGDTKQEGLSSSKPSNSNFGKAQNLTSIGEKMGPPDRRQSLRPSKMSGSTRGR